MGHHEAAEHKEPGQTTATEPAPPTAGVRADVVHPELMVDEEAKIRAYLPILEQMVDEGLVVLSDVDVIKYTHRLEKTVE